MILSLAFLLASLSTTAKGSTVKWEIGIILSRTESKAKIIQGMSIITEKEDYTIKLPPNSENCVLAAEIPDFDIRFRTLKCGNFLVDLSCDPSFGLPEINFSIQTGKSETYDISIKCTKVAIEKGGKNRK